MNLINRNLVIILILSFAAKTGVAADKETKGLLPELQINSTDENLNQKKAVESEILITKTENQAIQTLIQIIKKHKGTEQEPDLWYRLAELYMRRAKSGRFFDLNRDNDGPVRFAPPAIRGESAAANLHRAVDVYTKIERDFPKFEDMDAVLFNSAFASQQLGMKKNAEALYFKVVNRFPHSQLLPDSLLALGEMSYEDHKFGPALDFFIRIEKFPESRVYAYGMYKAAWAYYNKKDNDNAINKLVDVVKLQEPSKNDDGEQPSHNVNLGLRSEALRDLAIFYGETRPAEDAYNFFAKIASTDEVGEAMINLGKLYDSHSRFKEMNVFLNDFIHRQPNSKYRIKAETLMVNGNETARDRAEALKHLLAAADTCKPSSDWRKANAKIAESECDYDFAKLNIDIAKKWWELWQKNKQAKEAAKIADYTQQAFKVHLDREDPKNPDTKSHYAYAELLFQLGDYRQASKEYEFVSAHSQDTKIAHDASYSAIVALEKGMEKKAESEDHANVIRLSQNYLQHYPKGEHRLPLQFKIGFTYYEDNNFTEAEKWLRLLTNNTKAEDLILDILNARKDYAGIKTFSKEVISHTKDHTRIQALTKIMQEADYSAIQQFAKAAQPGEEKAQAANKLFTFFNENKNSPLAKDSLWQAMSLYYASGKVIDGADLAVAYAKAYPEDPRSIDALKDAAKYYADNGFLMEAAATLQTLMLKSPKETEQDMTASSELYLLDGNIKAAQTNLYKLLEAQKSPPKQAKIISQIMSTMKGQESSTEYKKLEAKIVSLGQEPYASQIKLKRVEEMFNHGKLSEAFNAAKPLVGSEHGVEDDVRARARLVQAKVLEKEFIETRTKTSLEKLSTILAIKTEKLDKAQTAYLTSAKIADDPNTKLEALQGLNRIYTNYVDTVGHPVVKDESQLSDADKKALAGELAKLTAPILEKKIDTDKQLKNLAHNSKAAGSNEIDFANLPLEQTVIARLKNIPVEQIKPYLPVLGDRLQKFSRDDSTSGKCLFSESDKVLKIDDLMNKANRCVTAKNASLTEKFADILARRDPKSPLGVYYMSYVAEFRNQPQKATWLMDLALKKTSDVAFLYYQKARSLYHEGLFAEGNVAFTKASDLGMKSPELTLIHGTVSYASGDCGAVIEDFGQLDRTWLSQFDLIPVLSECKAQMGEFEKAMSFAEGNVKGSAHAADIWLEIAHIQESYRFDSKGAITAYEAAFKSATQTEMKDWISRKIQFLKNKQTVSVLETSPTSTDLDGGHAK